MRTLLGRLQTPRFFEQLSLPERVLLSQLPFTISVSMVFVACVSMRPEETWAETGFLGGVTLTLVLTVLARVIPWQKTPPATYWVIPLLDFVAAALVWEYARFTLDGMVLLAAFPVVWLTWSGWYPRLALLLGFLGSAGVSWWPYIADLNQMTEAQLVRPAVIPLFMLALGVTASVLAQSMERQREQVTDTLALTRVQTRLLETVLETSPVGIVVTDRDGNDRLMNATQRRLHMVGVPPDMDDADESQLILYEPDGITPIPREERPVRAALRGEEFHDRVVLLGDVPGQQIASVSSQTMTDDDGEFDGTVVVFQNITELYRALRAREEIVADVSHEFRTPLTSIIGYLELAQDEEPDPVMASYLGTIQRNAERLLALVTSLLDAASNYTDLVLQPVDLVRLIRQSAESARVRASANAIRLVTNLPDEVMALGDAMKLSQVIDNLVSNAIKYTPAGGLVTLSAGVDDGWTCFSVADTGPGLTSEEANKVFESFYRTEQVRQAAIPGTGLGLAITQRLVEAHGGSITVDAEPGTGATFTVRLPAA